MDILANLYGGLVLIAANPFNFVYLFVGLLVGALIGLLPGIGSATTIAILLPFLYGKDPLSGIIMLCGIYYAAAYCGAITAILLRIPGDPNAVMTMLDGFELNKQGKAVQALAMAGLASFIGATLGNIGLTLLAEPVSNLGLMFGPPEHTMVMLMALVLLAAIGSEDFLKGLIATILGLMLGTVGAEPIGGAYRFSFGIIHFMDGINFIPLGVGFFAITDILINVEEGLEFKVSAEGREKARGRKAWSYIGEIVTDLKTCTIPILRASVIGFVIGVLPGTGASVATFFSYMIEKKVSKNPESFGTGNIIGVAAPEAANNSVVGGALVPMLTLGIPGSKSTAMMMVGLLMMGIRPGPLLMSQNPGFVWGLMSSLYLGNLLALIIIMPFAAIVMTRILNFTSYRILYPVILVVSFMGAFGVKDHVFEIWLSIFFGVVGYFLFKLGIPFVSLAIALILGPLFEKSFLTSLVLSDRSFSIFVTRPISAVMVAITVLIILSQFVASPSDLAKRIVKKFKFR
jgi:putative tricarboxylic transport membrane protein